MPIPGAELIEQASLLCWPGLESEFDGSWVLRSANGYTKRANSVQSLNPADDDNAAARIAKAVAWFEARKLPPVFRVTPLAGTRILAALDEARWSTVDHSKLMAMDLVAPPADPRAEYFEPWDDRFLGAQQALQGYSDATTAKLKALVQSLEVKAAGIVLYAADGRVVSSSLMAIARGIVITGNVVTDTTERRKGYAAAMMRSGLAWAWSAGARIAALNVGAENDAAQRLYGGLGYTDQYNYLYRVPPK